MKIKEFNVISQELALDFLKKAYFGKMHDSIDEFDLASNRAYRDLCRTLIFPNKPARNSSKSKLELFAQMKRGLRTSVTSMLKMGCSSSIIKTEYDKWHEDTCDAIISTYRGKGITMSYGQAQKWVNMFMKYLCVLSPETVTPLCPKLHVPFDNIVIDMAVEMGAFNRPLRRWSSWTKDEYLSHRALLNSAIERNYPDYSPIEWEFMYWNGENIEDKE